MVLDDEMKMNLLACFDVSNKLNNTPEFILKALNQTGLFPPNNTLNTFKNDSDFMLEVINKFACQALSYATKGLAGHSTLWLEPLREDDVLLEHPSKKLIEIILGLIIFLFIGVIFYYILCIANHSLSPKINNSNSRKLQKIKYNGDIKEEYCCQISFEIMDAPVFIEESFINTKGEKVNKKFYFEKNMIERWLNEHTTNPMTQQQCLINQLEIDWDLKREIEDFVSYLTRCYNHNQIGRVQHRESFFSNEATHPLPIDDINAFPQIR